jgi:hypothetical protein
MNIIIEKNLEKTQDLTWFDNVLTYIGYYVEIKL